MIFTRTVGLFHKKEGSRNNAKILKGKEHEIKPDHSRTSWFKAEIGGLREK